MREIEFRGLLRRLGKWTYGSFMTNDDRLDFILNRSVVIGNIHDNPELVEEGK
jgi:hypothetical protein